MFVVVVLRVIVGSILVGSLFSPGFVLTFCGGVVSAVAMAMVRSISRDLFSRIGISLIGSLTHVITQFCLVLFLYVQNSAVLFILLLSLFSGLIGGIIVGWIVGRVLPLLESARVHS